MIIIGKYQRKDMDLFDRSSMQDRSIYVHGSLRRTCTKCTRSCCVFKNCWFCLNKMCLSIRFCDLLFVYGICSMLDLEPSHLCGNCTLLEPWTSHLFGESKLCIWTVFPAFEGIISLTGSAILDLKLSTSTWCSITVDGLGAGAAIIRNHLQSGRNRFRFLRS